jgi:heat shock protein HslJ
MKSITALVALLFVVAACGDVTISASPSGAATPPPAGSEPPAAAGPEGPWQLTGGTVNGAPLVLVEGQPVTFIVEGKTVGGQSACNQYFGEFGLDGGQVRLTGLGGTEMACDEPTMTLEAAYMAGLALVEAATIDGDSLTLEGQGVELRFERLQPPPTADIVGTGWVLESVISGDAVSSTFGEPATLMLNADGTLTGSTGCRVITGRYVVNGAEIAFNELSTEGECPADLAGQDAHVIEVLGDGFRAAVDGQVLTLSDANGKGLGYRVLAAE